MRHALKNAKRLAAFARAFTLGVSIPLVMLAMPVHAAKDVLETPALPSHLVAERLLIDITRAGSRMVAVGFRGHIIYSDDEGKTWVQAKVPVSVLLTAVQFVTPLKGWAVGHGGVVLATKDGGKTWVKQFDGIKANKEVIAQADVYYKNLKAKFDQANDAEKEELSTKVEDAKYALEDAQADAETGPSKPLLDLWVKNEKEIFVVGAYGFFFKSNDGGITWKNYANRLDNQDRFHLNAIGQITGGGLFIVGEAGNIFRSDDQGETWQRVESPYSGSLFGLSGTGNVNEIVVFGLRGNLFKSVNLGRDWKKIDSGVENSLMSASLGDDGMLAIVGNSGVVLTSANAGESFKTEFRDDRLAVLSVVPTKDDDLVLVGESGVILADPSGKNL